MKNIRQTFLTATLLISLTQLSSLAAQGQLKVGDILPKHRMDELKNMSSPDFPVPSKPVKLYLIDFWSRWCGPCIAGFPKVEGIQYRFRDDIRILAVNPWNDDEEIRNFFDKYNSTGTKKNQPKKSKDAPLEVMVYIPSVTTPRMTNLPASNGDKSWFDLFDIDGVPHYVWMNDKGRILAITGSHELNAGNINHYLLTERLPKMTFKSNPETYNLGEQSLEEVWGKDAFPYQGNGLKIRDFYEGKGGSVYGYERLGVVDSVKKTIRYSFVNTPIADLYKAAWAMANKEHHRLEYSFGKPIVINSDTIKFIDVLSERLLWEVSQPEYYVGPLNEHYVESSAPGFNEWSFRAKFCAELILPFERLHEASRILLEGLNRYLYQKFGISGKIETRIRPCLVLKKKENYALQTSTAASFAKSYDAERQVEKYQKYPFNNIFLDYLPYRIGHNNRDRSWTTNSRGTHYMPRLNRNFPLIDETGITGIVDISLHIVPNDVNDPLKALNMRVQGTGLYFERELREIEMLVISDQMTKSPKTQKQL